MNEQELRNQVQGLWHQAVVQLEGFKHMVVRAASERFDVDTRRLQKRRAQIFTRVGNKAAHLANDSKVPLPTVVKTAISRLGSLAEIMAGSGSEPQRHAEPLSQHGYASHAQAATPKSNTHVPHQSTEMPSQERKKPTGKGAGRRPRRPRHNSGGTTA